LLILVVLFGLTACKAESTTQFAPYSLAPPSGAVIGDLGGVPVSIPREYVRLVAYDGDPNWLEKRTGPAPARTFESKLTSFGIMVHQPTMKPLTKENQSAYEKRGRWDTEWVEAGVLAASSLYSDFTNTTDFTRPYSWAWAIPDAKTGEKLNSSTVYASAESVHGLKAWRATKETFTSPPIILDDNNRDHSMYNHHLYFGYEDGVPIALIKCGSGLASVPGGLKTCHQRFYMLPEMKAHVSIAYRPEMLQHWRLYQQQFKELLLSFKTIPSVTTSTLSASQQPSVAVKH
jgi:hypothetical protein